MEYKRQKNVCIVRLDPGEPIIESLKEISEKLDIQLAFLSSGIGMITDLELGFFDKSLDTYLKQSFQEIYDLVLLHGNISRINGEVYPHVHIVMNDRNFNTIGGHLLEGKCEITLELFITISDGFDIKRKKIEGTPATKLMFD